MKNLLLYLIFFTSFNLFAQNKKVLLEEFTGTGCGNCPEAHYIIDSLHNIYPGIIPVSLHTYSSSDPMFFSQIDTIGIEYSPGAPLAAIDRIYSGSYVAQFTNAWENSIQTRLALAPKVLVSLNATWDNATRVISTNISCDIIQNLPIGGDYRFNLYVVEDSVISTNSAYDQTSFYDTDPSLPFFGLGTFISGYVHRHVVRAVLPNAWGQSSIITSSPLAGQTFSTTINYTLPASYDEQKVELVAFISRYTSNHQGDEVYNAEHIPLTIGTPVGIVKYETEKEFEVYPNPSNGIVYFEGKTTAKVILYSSTGQIIKLFDLKKGANNIDLSSIPKGIYYANMITGASNTTEKITLR